MIEKTKNVCIDCNLCKKACSFLTKYDINLKGFAKRKDLAFSCFLCDKCKQVCPLDLSGKQIAIEHRKASNNSTLGIEFMKNSYKFRNNSNKPSKYLLFLGCNYPGVYPKTTAKLIEIATSMGIDFSIDCCKKPVYELGGRAMFDSIRNLAKNKGVKTIITTCPNCYKTFNKHLRDVNVISIYEFLKDNGIGQRISGKIPIFFPCSDRIERDIFKHIKYFIEDYEDPFAEIGCCGLGGGARKHEQDLVEDKQAKLREITREKTDNKIYTYCASCGSIFRKHGLENTKNLLSEIIGVCEAPSAKYMTNVIKYKFKRR